MGTVFYVKLQTVALLHPLATTYDDGIGLHESRTFDESQNATMA